MEKNIPEKILEFWNKFISIPENNIYKFSIDDLIVFEEFVKIYG